MFRLDDFYVWDSWVADDGDRYHLYFLQAPRSLGDPGKRHVNASVGHATSRDLVDWDYLGTCFGPAESGFDDLAIWTGSVVREGDRWRMFYTAINTGGHHVYDQRVGSAVSDDLHHWRRVSRSTPYSWLSGSLARCDQLAVASDRPLVQDRPPAAGDGRER